MRGAGARAANVARIAVFAACGVGMLHAASSFYWAIGGQWLLPTVGEWAVDFVDRSPGEAGLLLGSIALIKALAALVPVAVAFNKIPWRRFWRASCWIGGLGLIAYGALNVVVSGAVLLGIIRPEGGYDQAAMAGHAFLWDPLFLFWGLALIVWLRASKIAQQTV